jgi:hypothetical protein
VGVVLLGLALPLMLMFQNCGVSPQIAIEPSNQIDSPEAADHSAEMQTSQLIAKAKSLPLEVAYKEPFDQAPQHWYSILAPDEDPWTSRYVKLSHSGSKAWTRGTYWIDNNHIKPTGAGTLNLYAFTYPKDIGLETRSFLEGTFRVRVRVDGFQISASTRIGLWFQAYDPELDRYVNYFQVAQTIDSALGYTQVGARAGNEMRTTDWVTVDIPFSGRDADWVCLGSNPDKLHIYGCSSSVARILGRKIHDFGIFGFMESTRESVPSIGALEIDDVEVLLRPGLSPLEVPLRIHQPAANQIVAGAKVTVRGTCPSGAPLEVAVGWAVQKHECRDDQFSVELPLSGRSGTLAVSVRSSGGPQLTIPIRYRDSVAPLAVKEVLAAPDSPSVLVRGTCDTSRAKVVVAIGSSAQTVPCSEDERFQAAFDGVAGSLSRISLGARYETDSSYSINETISVSQTIESLVISSPRPGDVIAGPSRKVEVVGVCTRAGAAILVAVGWTAQTTLCGSDGRFQVSVVNQDQGVNIAVAAKYASDPSYRIQFGVQFR